MEARIYYNSIAKGYSQLYHKEQQQKIKLVEKKFIKKGKALDLCSGDGILNSFLSKKLELYSLDFSNELLKLNSNKKENKFCCSSSKIPFENNYFDAIYSFTAMQDIIKLKKTFDEIKRVLKKEGQLILSFLKISKKRKKILELIMKNFKIQEQIEDEKDLIFVCVNIS